MKIYTLTNSNYSLLLITPMKIQLDDNKLNHREKNINIAIKIRFVDIKF